MYQVHFSRIKFKFPIPIHYFLRLLLLTFKRSRRSLTNWPLGMLFGSDLSGGNRRCRFSLVTNETVQLLVNSCTSFNVNKGSKPQGSTAEEMEDVSECSSPKSSSSSFHSMTANDLRTSFVVVVVVLERSL